MIVLFRQTGCKFKRPIEPALTVNVLVRRVQCAVPNPILEIFETHKVPSLVGGRVSSARFFSAINRFNIRWRKRPISITLLVIFTVLTGACSHGGTGADTSPQSTDASAITTLQPKAGEDVSKNVPSSAQYLTPTVTFNSTGNGLAIWVMNTGSSKSLLFATYDAQEKTWSSELVLQSNLDAYFSYAVATNGTSIALTWENGREVFAQIMTFGPSPQWDETRTLTSDRPSADDDTLRIASDGHGYIVAWHSSFQGLLSRIFDGQNWATENSQVDLAFDDQFRFAFHAGPVLTGSLAGYVLAWTEFSRTTTAASRVRANRLNLAASDKWQGTKTISDTMAGFFGSSLTAVSNDYGYAIQWSFYSNATLTNRTSHVGVAVFDTRVNSMEWSAPFVLSDIAVSLAATPCAITAGPTGFGTTWVNKSADSSIFTRHARIYEVTNELPEWGPDTVLDDKSWLDTGQIAASNTGYATVWQSEGQIKRSIYTNRTWSDPSNGLQQGLGLLSYSAVSNGTGYAFIAHTIDPAGSYQVVGSIYDNDMWAPTTAVSNSYSFKYSPQRIEHSLLSTDGVGYWATTPITTTSSGRPVSHLVTRRVYPSLEAEVPLTTQARRGDARLPRLVNMKDGALVAVWQQFESGDFELFASIRRDSSWSEPERLNVLNDSSSSNGEPVLDAEIHLLVNGNQVALVWNPTINPTVRFYDGKSWGVPIRLSPLNGEYAFASDVHSIPYRDGFAFSWVTSMIDITSNSQSQHITIATYTNHIFTLTTLADLIVPLSNPEKSTIASLDERTLLSVWVEDSISGPSKIKAVTLRDGVIGDPVTVHESAPYYLELALHGDGVSGPYLTWYSPALGTVVTHRDSATGVWDPIEKLSDYTDRVLMASDSSNTLMAWYSGHSVQSRFINDGDGQSFASEPSELVAGNNWPHADGLATNGRYYAYVWNATLRDLGTRAMFALFNGKSWSDIQLFDDPTETMHRAEPHIISIADNFATTWVQWNTSNESVRDVWVQAGGFR